MKKESAMMIGVSAPAGRRRPAGRAAAAVAAVAALLAVWRLAAEDLPGWRGAGRDGKVSWSTAPRAWPQTLKEEWRVTVGEGHSSPIVVGGRAYLLARQGEDEVALCLDAACGRELWRDAYPAPYKEESAARQHGKGPKATPAVGGGRLFTFGISGILSCFEAQEGKVRWRKDFSKEYPSTSPLYGAAASPLVEGDLCIVPIGGHDKGALAAFEAANGKLRWSWAGDGPAYSSAIAVELASKRQVVVLMQRQVVGVEAQGDLLWSIPFKTPYDQNIVTPLLYQETLIYSGLEQGTTAIRLTPRDAKLLPREVWRNAEVSLYMSSPVVEGDRIFAFSPRKRGTLFCLEARTGKILWQSPPGLGENAALLSDGKLLWLLTTGGELIVQEVGAAAYKPSRKYKVADSPTWAHPAVLPERVLIRDEKTLAAFSLSG